MIEGGNSMNEQKEAIKTRLLSKWLDNLRETRQLEITPEIEQLDVSDIEEVIALARFAKGVAFPTPLPNGKVAQICEIIKKMAVSEHKEWVQEVKQKVKHADNFGQLISTMIDEFNLTRGELSTELGIHEGLMRDIEVSQAPPIRLPIDAMLSLLRKFQLNMPNVIQLIQSSTLKWIGETYPKSETQIARIDFGVKDWERRLLLEDSEEKQEELSNELHRLEKYINELKQKLFQSANSKDP